MRAAYYNSLKNVTVKEVPIPKIKDDEVLVRVAACGICGTDVHIFHGMPGSAEAKPPVILGHEFSGVICEAGRKVTNLVSGDRVAIDPNITCGICRYCKKGKIHLCENLTAVGVTSDGGFAEYCAVPYKQAYKIDDNLDLITAAMAEPVACCVHGIDLAEIMAGDIVLIIGAGTIGLIMLQLAKYSGAAKIIVSDIIQEKLEKAKRLGADIVINPNKMDIDEFLCMTDGGADVTIECVGLPICASQAISMTAKGGNIVLFGVASPDAYIEIKPFEVFKKELTIRASFVNPFTMERALKLLAGKRVIIDDAIGGEISLDELNEVLSRENPLSNGKIIVKL